jgi:hypothetical protein
VRNVFSQHKQQMNTYTILLCISFISICILAAPAPPKPIRYTIKVTPAIQDPDKNTDILKYYDDYQNRVFRMDWMMKTQDLAITTRFYYFDRTKQGFIVYDESMGGDTCLRVPTSMVNETNFGFMNRAYRQVSYQGTAAAKSTGEECHLWERKEQGQISAELVSVATGNPVESWINQKLENVYSEYSTDAKSLGKEVFEFPVDPHTCKNSTNRY